jgi:hypothetical protein
MPGTWTGAAPITFTFAWQRCAGGNCVAIAGATNATYTPASADVGATLRVLVTAANSFGSATALSPQTAAVTSVPASTSPPTVVGLARGGGYLVPWSGA